MRTLSLEGLKNRQQVELIGQSLAVARAGRERDQGASELRTLLARRSGVAVDLSDADVERLTEQAVQYARLSA